MSERHQLTTLLTGNLLPIAITVSRNFRPGAAGHYVVMVTYLKICIFLTLTYVWDMGYHIYIYSFYGFLLSHSRFYLLGVPNESCQR